MAAPFNRELINEVCLQLRNEDRGQRQSGLKKLLKYCEGQDTLTEDNSLDLFDLVYLHILKCYADESEKCRSLATSIVSKILEKLPRNDFYLNYIVPAIARRMGRAELVEQSEEMRLQWLEQIKEIVQRYAITQDDSTDYLLKVYNDLMDILKKSLTDPFPVAQRETCDIIQLLSTATPSFHYQAETLVKPLLLMLKHKQSANRTVAIATLGTICQHITTNTECILNMLTELRLMLLDSIPAVRRECGRVGGQLMLKLRDRYSHFDKILPLVLCCLDDDTTDVSTEIRSLWTKCGDQYYEENEQELSKCEFSDEMPVNYPPDLIRPTLGCRAICQRSLKLIDRALNDMEEWQEAVRLHATKLLTQLLIHCEKSVGPLLIEIIPVLASKCDDEDRLVAKEALKAAKIMGVLIDFKNWKGHMLESLVKWKNLGNIKCLAALFASSAQGEEKWKSLEEILAAIIEVELYFMGDSVFQEHLLFFMEMLIKGYLDKENGRKEDKEKEGMVAYQFYRVLMTVLAYCGPEEAIQAKAEELLEMLLMVNSKLHENHLPTILKGLDFLEEGADEAVLFLHGLIVYGGFRSAYLDELIVAIKKVLNESDNAEGKVKLLSGVSIALRRWPETMTGSSGVEVVNNFIDQCLLKGIIWKAGTSSEAIRSIATVALFALLESDKQAAVIVIPSYVKYLIGLMEDQSVATRQYSTRIMTLMGPMDVQNLKLASEALLSRLNDPNRDVREHSIKALALLQMQDGGNEDDVNIWSQLIRDVFQGISLHLHDSDEKTRRLLLDTLAILSKRHSEEFKKVFADQTDSPPCRDAIDELMKSIGVLTI